MPASSIPLLPLRRIVEPCLSAAALASIALAGNVHTVGGTGGDYPDIQSAVDASADGDVVLVRSGNYPGFLIDGKSISVVADTNDEVALLSSVNVGNIGAGQTVVLAGLHVIALPAQTYACFSAYASSGSVRLQSCRLGEPTMLRGQGASFTQCGDVALVGCILRGCDGYDPIYGGGPGGAALSAQGGRTALYDCTLVGGRGQDGYDGSGAFGGDGGDGCDLSLNASLFASGTTFQGRDGGRGSNETDCFDLAGDGGNGGDGIRSTGPVLVGFFDCVKVAGAGGTGGAGGSCGPDGLPGAAGVPQSLTGTVDVFGGSARQLVMPTPVRESTSIPITLRGEPGETAYLGMWGGARYLYSTTLSGVLLGKAPLIRRVNLGTIPASGVLDKHVALPDLGAGVQGKTYFFQAYFVGAGNVVTLGSPAFVVELDSAF